MIAADKWPEWADRHCWDEDGIGMFYGSVRRISSWQLDCGISRIPRPLGHDWRVPVMRPAAPAIDLGQFRDLIGFACLQAINLPETDPRRDYIRQCSDLLALIDGQKAP